MQFFTAYAQALKKIHETIHRAKARFYGYAQSYPHYPQKTVLQYPQLFMHGNSLWGRENCRNQKNKINSSRIRAAFWYKKEEPERMYKIKIELQGVCSPSAENKH